MLVSSDKSAHLIQTPSKPTSFQCFLFAFAVSTALVAVCINLGLIWEGNDDPIFSFIHTQTDYSIFQWRILCVTIHKLNTLFPMINWWSLCSVFAIWIGAVTSLYVIYSRYPIGFCVPFTPIFCQILWYVALQQLNFTRTAVVAAMGGILLIADCIFCDKNRNIKYWQYILGCLLFLFAASIREDSAKMALGYLAIIGFIRLVSSSFSLSKQWFYTNRRQIILLCITAIIFFAAERIDSVLLTSEQLAYRDYNRLRSYVQDFSANYPDYSEISDQCSAVGISSNAFDLLLNWVSEDTEAFSIQNLTFLNSLATQSGIPLRSIMSIILQEAYTPSVIAFFAILCLLFWKKHNWIRNFIIVCFSVAVTIALAKFGRFPIRLYMCLLWLTVLSCAFLSGFDWKNEKPKYPKPISDEFIISLLGKYKLVSLILAVGIVCTGFLGLRYYKYSGNYKAMIQERQAAQSQYRSAVDQIHNENSHIYFVDIMHSPASISGAFSFWEPYPYRYCSNLFGLGGWDARHPYHVSLLEEYGIKNPVRALFERTDVYSAYSERILNYLRSDYDSTITCTQVGVLAQAPLVQYTPFISDDSISEIQQESVIIENFQTVADNKLSFCASVPEEDTERIFYVNFTINGERHTYRLAYDRGTVSGLLYDISADAEINHSDIIIFEQLEDRYIGYNIVWQ